MVARASKNQPAQRGPRKAAVKAPKVGKLRKDSWLQGVDKPTTDQQERFALEYLRDFDRLRALAAAGYKVTSAKNGQSQASYLLNLPNVAMFVARKKMEIATSAGMDAQNTIGYMKAVFFEAFTRGDYAGAMKALTEIGRVYGIYEEDHSQKARTPEDLVALRARLETMGFDFTRKNFPPHLVGKSPSDFLRPLEIDRAAAADPGTDVRGPVPGATGPDRTDGGGDERPAPEAVAGTGGRGDAGAGTG